jgi:dTDP-4-amino-4,6-dideoxygalactose transaminase
MLLPLVFIPEIMIAEKLRVLRNYGSRIKYQNEVQGYNSRLDELQSAFLRKKLPLLDADNAYRSKIASRYSDGLAGLKNLSIPVMGVHCEHAWHLYVVRHSNRDNLQQRLKELGVGTMIHYPVPPHLQPAYSNLNLSIGQLPISEAIHREALSLPIGPTMTLGDVDAVIAMVHKAHQGLE